jgi:4-hydroxybenzoate polyprenyltransferase
MGKKKNCNILLAHYPIDGYSCIKFECIIQVIYNDWRKLITWWITIMAVKKNKEIIKQNVIIAAVKVLRPVHWIKNLALFAALIFTGTLFIESYFIRVSWAFVAFCFITSAAYIFNDIFDAKQDRLHPIKKARPIASGTLPVWLAVLEFLGVTFLSISIAYFLDPLFLGLVLLYLVIQLSYTLIFKNFAIIDILFIAAGFIIRVYAGAVVINAHLSVWFLLCVVSVALFLASGKRRAELNSLTNTKDITRRSLTHYSKELLDSYVTMFGSAAWMSWALFTFFESPRATLPVWLFLAEISKATTINKLLMVTIPVVIFGIMRYESVIFEEKSEAPEKVLLSDSSLVFSVILWTTLVIWILYGGVASSV